MLITPVSLVNPKFVDRSKPLSEQGLNIGTYNAVWDTGAMCTILGARVVIDVLIGMDIITLGDFAITNFGGKTVMSYRYPSVCTIDFAKEDKQENT